MSNSMTYIKVFLNEGLTVGQIAEIQQAIELIKGVHSSFIKDTLLESPINKVKDLLGHIVYVPIQGDIRRVIVVDGEEHFNQPGINSGFIHFADPDVGDKCLGFCDINVLLSLLENPPTIYSVDEIFEGTAEQFIDCFGGVEGYSDPDEIIRVSCEFNNWKIEKVQYPFKINEQR